jgi:hypothetical protein
MDVSAIDALIASVDGETNLPPLADEPEVIEAPAKVPGLLALVAAAAATKTTPELADIWASDKPQEPVGKVLVPTAKDEDVDRYLADTNAPISVATSSPDDLGDVLDIFEK